MGESSGSIWERIVAWFRGMLGTSTGQDTSSGSSTGSGLGSLKDTAAKAAASARDAASQAADRARSTVDDVTTKAKGTVDDLSNRAQTAKGSATDQASGAMSGARDRASGAVDNVQSRLSGAASSVTSRGYDTGAAAGVAAGAMETSDATAEDMAADGQDNRGTATAGATTGMTSEDLDQGGPDTAERPRAEERGSATGGFKENDVTSEENAPAETGEGVTSAPNPAEHPEADQAATDVGTSGRPFAHTDDDWWDTDRPGMGTGSSLGEQGAASETGTEGPVEGGLGPSASAADVGTSTVGASYGGVDASGSGTGATTAGGDTGAIALGGAPSTSAGGTGGADYTAGGSGSSTASGTGPSGAGGAAGANVGGNTSTSVGETGSSQTPSASYGNNANAATLGSGTATTDADTSGAKSTLDDFTGAGGYTSAAGAEADVVGGYGESGTSTADTSSLGVDSPATAPDVGYAGSSPATDREGVGSYAPSAATGGGTGASSNDANLVEEAPSDQEVRQADQTDAALAGTGHDETDLTADASAGTTFDETPDNAEDYSTAQGIVVGGLIAEDQQETGGEYTDEILVDAETQQAELPAADYEDLPTDTADTTEGAVTTTLGDQTSPAPTQASMTGTTGRGMTPDTAQGSEAAYEAAYGAPRGADANADAGTGAGASGATTGGASTSAAIDANAPTAGVRGVNWVPGDGGHEAPEGFPLKGNASSMIYHPRESSTYERTIAEYYFATPEDAEAAGYRLPKALQNNGELTADAGRSTAAGVATTTTGGDAQSNAAQTAASQPAASAKTATGTQHGTRTAGQQNAAQTSARRERPAPKGALRAQGASCPDDYPIKGNANSRIYHLPAESSYEQTIPEFCFATEADAKAAGFRARKH